MQRRRHSGLFPKQKSSITYVLNNVCNYPWVEEIILFGSCAKNSNKYSSDVDILFVTSNEYMKYKDDIHHTKCVLCGLPDDEFAVIDPKFMEKQFFDTQKSTFLNNVRREGVVLWTRNHI